MKWFAKVEFNANTLVFHLSGKAAQGTFVGLGRKTEEQLLLEVTGNGNLALGYIFCIGQELLTGIKLSNEVFIRAMHAYQQSASAKLSVIVFIHVVTFQLVYLIDNKVPTAQVEVTHAEINALYAHVGNNALKSVGESGFEVVIDTSHRIAAIYRVQQSLAVSMFRFFGMLVGALNLLLKSVSYLKSLFEDTKRSVPSALSYS